MGLHENIASAAQAALRAVGGLGTEAVYRPSVPASYDPATGQVSSGTREIRFLSILYRTRSNEIDNIHILANDCWMIVLPNALGDVVPKEGDEVRADGTVYKVVAVHKIIGSKTVFWKLRIRAAK